MTIQEMHLAFDRVVDIVATQGYPGAEPEEKDFYINRAIERFVKTRYSGNNVKGKGFEESQKRKEDLRTLIVRNPLTGPNVVTLGNGEWLYTLPTGAVGSDPKYLFHLSSNAIINKDECGNTVATRKIKTKLITYDQKEEFLDDPFHTSDYDEVLMTIEGTTVVLYTNSLYDILDFNMTYLKYPATVNSLSSPAVNCDLPDHTHQEIVDNAARLYVAGIADLQRTQIETQIIKEQE